MTTEFAVNTIPTASLVLSLGQSSRGIRSATHKVLEQSGKKQKAVVRLEITPKTVFTAAGTTAPDPDEIPEGEFVLFEGTTTGYGYQSLPDRRGFALNLEHWLSDLNYSSSLSAGLHPACPGDLSFPGFLRTVSGNTNNASGLTPAGIAYKLLAADVADDLWKNGLYKWFKELASTDSLADVAQTGDYQLARLLGGRPDSPNSSALAALARMIPADAVPLKLIKPSSGPAATTIAENIKKQIASEAGFESIWSRTIWDILVSHSAQFMFGIIPTVSSAYVVPWMPVQKKEWKTIFETAADRQSISGDTPRNLRAVALRTWGGWQGGAAMPDQSNPTRALRELGLGVYINPTVEDGQTLVRDAPKWLAEVNHELAVAVTNDPKKLLKSGPSGANAAPTTGYTGTEIMEGLSPVMNSFAKAIFAAEVFKMKQGAVYGRLRTDIAPGSSVKCNLVGGGDGLTDSIYGNAVGVITGVDCEALQAYTGFTLAHNRTEKENASLGLDDHPLYDKPWIGTRLV